MLALVTGSGVRVGQAIALALLDAGYDLLLHVHRSKHGAGEVVRAAAKLGRKAEVISADLTAAGGVQKLATEVQRITKALDLLVNNAATYEKLAFEDLD